MIEKRLVQWYAADDPYGRDMQVYGQLVSGLRELS